ncbi:alpha/beta fold hydrolase [Streptosporangiaceae bacterium NEAU-GS5]|nr:alpha/beta fold hydrolase [Streptosporangiaceae bacterium NEAU-GS5]
MSRPIMAFIPPSCSGAGYFHKLRAAFGDRVDVRPVELPGHGRRAQEDAVTRADLAVRDVLRRLGGRVDVVYGESLGAYIGLGVVYALGAPRLVAASNSPPSVRETIRLDGVNSIETAAAAMRALGGEIPAEVVEDPDLAEYAYPLIRDDLYLSQSFNEYARDIKIPNDVLVIAGERDSGVRRLDQWSAHTRGRCDVVRLPGGHLLSMDNPDGVAKTVLDWLEAA